MIIPIYPYKVPAVKENDESTHEHVNYHNQMSQQLRYWFGGDNQLLPVLYDPVTKKLMVNENGTFTVITHT